MIAGVVADDPTGATDTGHELAARGLRTLASASGTATGEAPGPVDVHVVDADSRYVDPEEATTAVARVIDGRDHPFVYKKTDSTLG
ncbi:four-carbon acid sugar kinase family protein [Halorarum salinum]|uniref:four-carbon acid sugar kinase family protein n=1 Tax=Halorarum salinum TaxID=2743089 RepID=UPI001FEC6D6D|nr:four-carbon acid sugar kinase family protein [Halobaculum salinum]